MRTRSGSSFFTSDGKIYYHVLIDFGEVSNSTSAPTLTLRSGPNSGSSTQHITLLATFNINPRPTAFPLVDNTRISNPNYSRPSLCSCLEAYYVPSRHWPSLRPRTFDQGIAAAGKIIFSENLVEGTPNELQATHKPLRSKRRNNTDLKYFSTAYFLANHQRHEQKKNRLASISLSPLRTPNADPQR